jgi:mono/diheme cytochrome c family protein
LNEKVAAARRAAKLMKHRLLARGVIFVFPLACLATLWPVHRAEGFQSDDTFEKTVRPFFSDNCYVCHNPDLKSGGLNLQQYQTSASIAGDKDTLKHILGKLQTGQMPPAGMPRPDHSQTDAVTAWITAQIGPASTARSDRPEGGTESAQSSQGRLTAHRLNRTEYNNTVRDLLGVDFHPADDFPQDDSGYGFDNIGDVLSLSPVLMEKYLAAAEKIAHTAVFGPERLQSTLVRLHSRQARIITSPKPLFDYDQTGLALPNALHTTYRFPVDGEYVIRTLLGGVRPAGSEPLQIALWIDDHQEHIAPVDAGSIATFDRDRQELYGLRVEIHVKLTAGDHWIAASIPRLYEGLPVSYNGPNPSKRPVPPPPEFEPPPGLPPQKLAELKEKFEARQAEVIPANSARVTGLEIGGPYAQTMGPSAQSLKDVYACGHLDGHHQSGCARKIVETLARRAYRLPVASAEVDKLVNLVTAARKQGDSLEEGLCVAIEAILVSPRFLFRIEADLPAASPAGGRISQYEIASRLSYFLWSSMPDDELLHAADNGTLSQPAVLEAQVRRMLMDPKSHALAENFAGQWLELRKLESVQPDRERFPEFDDYLRMSMRKETEMFFESIVSEDRSILDFIDGNYSFLNELLAELYHIPGVKGPQFRKVTLSPNTRRSGVLTQASVLTVSSYATRTSPVLRGKWILGNIVNAPPPPPPPDVPNLDEAKIGTSMSMREQLELHRKNATCAACHSRMDPLGFGLENFDGIGAWRTVDGKFPIDASGTLPNGTSFKGPQELEAILKADPAAFTEGLTRKLLTYALGRGLERFDDAAVKKITASVAAGNYRFSSLVLEIVKSPPFQMRTGESAP